MKINFIKNFKKKDETKTMNSIKSIPIESSKNQDELNFTSKSVDFSLNSWKLEKKYDSNGKANYKLISDSSEISNKIYSNKKKMNARNKKVGHISINSYGASTSYPAVSHSIKPISNIPSSSLIKSAKRIKKIDMETTNNVESFSIAFERCCDATDIISKSVIVGNRNSLVPYTDEHDFFNKSLFNGHLSSHGLLIDTINVLLIYDGKIDVEFQILMWYLTLYPKFELVNFDTITVNNLYRNKGKYIYQKIDKSTPPNSILFITLHSPCDVEGPLKVKYTIDAFSRNKTQEDIMIDFDYLPRHENETKKSIITDNGGNELPKLSKNIFGDFIKQMNHNNIPIFSNKKSNVPDIPLKSQQKYQPPAYDPNEEDVDFTERENSNIKSILSLLNEE